MADMKKTLITLTAILTLILGGCEKQEIIVEKPVHDTVYIQDTVYLEETDDTLITWKLEDQEISIGLSEDQFIQEMKNAGLDDLIAYTAIDGDLKVYNILNEDNMKVNYFMYFDNQTGEFSHLRSNYRLEDDHNKVQALETAYWYYSQQFTEWYYTYTFNEGYVSANLLLRPYDMWIGLRYDEDMDYIYYFISVNNINTNEYFK